MIDFEKIQCGDKVKVVGMADLLRELGYGDGIDVFMGTDLWYS